MHRPRNFKIPFTLYSSHFWVTAPKDKKVQAPIHCTHATPKFLVLRSGVRVPSRHVSITRSLHGGWIHFSDDDDRDSSGNVVLQTIQPTDQAHLRLLDPLKWDEQVMPKRRQLTTNLRYVTGKLHPGGSLKSRQVTDRELVILSAFRLHDYSGNDNARTCRAAAIVAS
jgi:hypothetical protein